MSYYPINAFNFFFFSSRRVNVYLCCNHAIANSVSRCSSKVSCIFVAVVHRRLTCFPVSIIIDTYIFSFATIYVEQKRQRERKKNKLKHYHNLFWLPSCGDSHFAPVIHSIFCSVFAFFISLWAYMIGYIYKQEFIGISQCIRKELYTHTTNQITYLFIFPKRSWRSTVVAHFRFNKNVFIYWRVQYDDDDDDGGAEHREH